MKRLDDARQLILSIHKSEAYLIPNHEKQTLTVRLHHQANHRNANMTPITKTQLELRRAQLSRLGSRGKKALSFLEMLILDSG